jgi:hypothetical protein
MLIAALAASATVIAGTAKAAERDVTCRGKLTDVSEATFRVGKCLFVRDSYPNVLAACSKHSKTGRFLRNLDCVAEAPVDEPGYISHVYSARPQ